jgi:hypothetical protein
VKKEVIQFLEAVWLNQPRGKYACVAWKEGELWRQRFIHRDDIERAYQNRGRDLYFCPNLFSVPDRTNEAAEPSRWLYADLDEVDPTTIPGELNPTMWWETSPGRFQALWELDKALGRKAHDAVNQRLTYFLHADLNGWPMNKVLRVPGSVSTKWGKPWHIHQGNLNGGISVAKVWAEVRDTKVPAHSSVKLSLSIDDKRRVKALTPNLPKGCAALLRRRYVQDRSSHIYHLAKDMVEAGLDTKDMVLLLSTSPVAQEKYAGRMEEELNRVVAKVAVEPTKKKTKKKDHGLFKVQEMNRFLARQIKPPGWLVGGIWSNEAHGIIAGEEKVYKSMFVQDLAVSIATGTDFLNYFPVPKEKVGPVIYVQEENQESMVQDRFLKICSSRGLGGRRGRLPEKMPLQIINNNGVDLTSNDHMQELARLIQLHKAKFIILDPFYLMTPGVDENSASDVVPVLANLLKIKHSLGCGILIVHHYNKGDSKNPRPGGATGKISGSGAFGRWYESMLLIERDDEMNTVKIYPKHRMSALEPPVKVEFDMGDMGDLRYEPHVTEMKSEARDLYAELRVAVEESPGISVAALGKMFEMRPERMSRLIAKSTHFQVERVAGRSPSVMLRRNRR